MTPWKDLMSGSTFYSFVSILCDQYPQTFSSCWKIERFFADLSAGATLYLRNEYWCQQWAKRHIYQAKKDIWLPHGLQCSLWMNQNSKLVRFTRKYPEFIASFSIFWSYFWHFRVSFVESTRRIQCCITPVPNNYGTSVSTMSATNCKVDSPSCSK